MTDALFQESADRHSFSYEPEAWEQMETLLDAEQATRRRRVGWYTGIGSVLVILLLYVIGQRYGSPPPGPQETIPAHPSADKKSDAVITPGKIYREAIGASDSPAEPSQIPRGSRRDVTAATAANEAFPDNDVVAADRGREIQDQQSKTFMGLGFDREKTNTLPPATVVPPNSIVRPAAPAQPIRPVTARTAVPVIEPLPILPVLHTVFQAEWPEAEILPPDNGHLPAAGSPLISAGVAAGTVFGAVGNSAFGQGGVRFGAKINYHLGRKFAFGTGLYLNSVKYQASGEEYLTEEGFWTYDVQPESVFAQCDILDIPLSFTYHLRGSDKSGLYVATGVTSYLMLKEFYAYEYEIPNNDFIKSWTETNTNRHYLGLGVLSLGYQRKRGRRSAFQLESFIHLPLQKIGHGRVKLMAAGASVNYVFGFKK